jgi:hypothetical protein
MGLCIPWMLLEAVAAFHKRPGDSEKQNRKQ